MNIALTNANLHPEKHDVSENTCAKDSFSDDMSPSIETKLHDIVSKLVDSIDTLGEAQNLFVRKQMNTLEIKLLDQLKNLKTSVHKSQSAKPNLTEIEKLKSQIAS